MYESEDGTRSLLNLLATHCPRSTYRYDQGLSSWALCSFAGKWRRTVSLLAKTLRRAVPSLETKGKSKISAKEVIAARKLKVANPEMSMQAIKDKLGLKIHVIMVGRLIRGISHGHLDMCGLKVRPFVHREDTKPAAKKRLVKKVAAKPAAKKALTVVRKTRAAKPAAAEVSS
jgi:hypothetical protein